jgi:hypothetical protein
MVAIRTSLVSTVRRQGLIKNRNLRRGVLKVAYETGSRLRKLGVLIPDAVCDDGRPLFLLSPEPIQNARQRISQHRTRIARFRHNLPLL